MDGDNEMAREENKSIYKNDKHDFLHVIDIDGEDFYFINSLFLKNNINPFDIEAINYCLEKPFPLYALLRRAAKENNIFNYFINNIDNSILENIKDDDYSEIIESKYLDSMILCGLYLELKNKNNLKLKVPISKLLVHAEGIKMLMHFASINKKVYEQSGTKFIEIVLDDPAKKYNWDCYYTKTLHPVRTDDDDIPQFRGMWLSNIIASLVEKKSMDDDMDNN